MNSIIIFSQRKMNSAINLILNPLKIKASQWPQVKLCTPSQKIRVVFLLTLASQTQRQDLYSISNCVETF
jgi:hypothetical protein